MPVYKLLLSYDSDGVDSLVPTPDSVFGVNLVCSSCNTPNEAVAVLDPAQEEETKGGRGSANMVWKCKFCSREGSMSLVGDVKKEVAPCVMKVECRGSADLAGWDPRMSTWKAVSESGAEFDADLTDDWTEYDEDGGHPLDISNVKGTVQKE
eukprot:PhM_4_TR18972/c0_g1_i1/m.44033